MAAVSARLANMGFMKRKAPQQPQEAQQPAAAGSQQQQQQSLRAAAAAVKQQEAVQDSLQQAAGSNSNSISSDRQQQQAGKKYKLSDNIANMKFMQRAQLKRSREEAGFEQERAAKDAAEWVSATAVQDKGCLILHERDPLPAGASGRMSFGFGHLHDLQQAEEAERQAAAEAAATEKQVQDDEMAGRYGGSMRAKDKTPRRDTKRQRR